jgi:hypothetical protein
VRLAVEEFAEQRVDSGEVTLPYGLVEAEEEACTNSCVP